MPGRPQPEPTRSVFLGAVDWRHAPWQGVFYPDGMPEDWLLAYYNTQFDAVFLPYANWATTRRDELRLWCEDTRPDFRFVLEAQPPGGLPPQADARALGDRLGLLAQRDDPALLWFDVDSDLKDLAAEIVRLPKPLFLFSRDSDLQGLQRTRTLLELMGL